MKLRLMRYVSYQWGTGLDSGYTQLTQPAPLKCGKYEEFEPAHSVGTANLMATTIPDRCVPILHTLTEKDWQGS